MPLPIVFRDIARQEFDESISWYENQRTGLGIQFADEIDLWLSRIAGTPEQFRQVRGEVRQAVLRRFPYTIQFLIESNRIVVLGVFHVKRNPRRLEGR
ncbi:MAG: type II toxin-antitoxin system RelE/ParE family toxin [Acidobacteriota bacterium]